METTWHEHPDRRRAQRGLTAIVLALVAAVIAVLAPAQAAWAGDGSFGLSAGETLQPNQRLVSSDGQYVLRMQQDGNLVLYAPGNRAVWATGTNVQNSFLGLQGDGNLVVYTPAPNPRPVWASGTSGANLRLELQNDGNAVIYNGGAAAWSAAGIGIGDRGNIGRVQFNAYVHMRDMGWADSEWSCLNNVFSNESGWRWNAANGQVYGIPQANPGSKMATTGADWRDNAETQVRWGLSYISGKYGSPCRAWQVWWNNGRAPHSY